MDPLVSVVIPFYNQERFVDEALSSVLSQAHPRIELIAADDASTDGTLEALRRFETAPVERIRILSTPVNLGISGNMNRALAEVTGEFVAWMGGDDVMLPGKLDRQVRELRRHPEAVASVHDAEVFDSDSGRVLGRFTDLYNGRRGVRDGGVELVFDPTYFMLPSATMFRAAAMPPHGFDERLRFGNDLLWYIELLRQGRVVGSDDVLVRYRRHASNVTADSETQARKLEEGLMTMAIVESRYPELARLGRRREAAFLLVEAGNAAASGNRRAAARFASAALSRGGIVDTSRESLRLARGALDRRRGR